MPPLIRAVAPVAWVLVSFAAAAFGGQFPPGDWYAALRKPSWNPPNWIFGPVWTLLYAMMGVAAWLVWREGGLHRRARPLILFLFQLVLNALWSWLFFGLHLPFVAFVELCTLWAAIVATMVAFRRVRPLAGYLLVPYQLWVTFAAALNFELWRLNR